MNYLQYSRKKGTMPNEAFVKPIPFPVYAANLPQEPKRLWWLVRFGIWIGTLMTKPDDPKGWGWNPSVITLCILIGGILFTAGMYIQQQRSAIEYLQRDAEATRDIAGSAKRESTYAVAKVDGGDGHAVKATPTPTPTPQ